MCLILFSYRQYKKWPLVIAANRDEFHSRPSDPADFWEDAPSILAGRDQLHGGTWLGLDRYGRFSAVTNYQDPSFDKMNKLSRGKLVSNFLLGNKLAEHHLHEVKQQCHRYNGFNLLAEDESGLFYLSSSTGKLTSLPPELYGISNDLIDSACPKLEKGKARLEKLLLHNYVSDDKILELLSDTTEFLDNSLPDTGTDLKQKQIFSPIFIKGQDYGTRCSTAVIINSDDKVRFTERTFNKEGREIHTATYNFMIDITKREEYAR